MSKKLLGLSLLMLASSTFAANDNFKCPHPNEINSTDFTAPSIWTAPAVAGAAPDTVGLGLGGKRVKLFLGATAARLGDKDGWVCVYSTEGGLSVNEYEARINQEVHSMKFDYLKKYSKRINEQFKKLYPFLEDYDDGKTPLGFIGYQAADK